MRATVPLEFPGFRNNTLGSGFFDSPAKLNWATSGGSFAGSCGNAGARIQNERGEGWIEAPGFSCVNPGGVTGDTYNLQVVVCDGVSGCQRTRNVTVDLTGPAIAAALCPPPPRPWSCNETGSCQAGCMGPNGSGAGGRGAGGSSAAGGGPGLGGEIFGGGAFLRYQAGGVGHPSHPMPADWTQLHGRFWSHDYAERVVPDPDDSHVWLLTRFATFREFTDGDLDGVYETVSPSDDYRRLTKTAGGWELRELDGTVHAYDLNGRWISTTDRNGNAIAATYDASSRLERVDFPDARYELFAYDAGGRLATITEVGVDGTSTRTWGYSWTGDDLTSISRPDGRHWSLLYEDPAHQGYLTRLTLIGEDGVSERIEGAWEFDAAGNVVATWRGAASKDDPGAVEKWEFSFDDPALPVNTTVTDPLGNVSGHTFGRDDVSQKPRLEGVSGDCPTACGAGPNSSTSFEDLAHPLRPTTRTRGASPSVVTQMTYDAFGQLLSLTEAFGEPEERTTTWTYDTTYPSLVTRVEQPSTTGQPLDLRVAATVRDATGNPTNDFEEGVENAAAFSYETTRTFTAEGMLETVNGPDHGADDLVTFVYDPARGGLILEERIDPLIGSTVYVYDAFNRRISETDVNGVETVTEYDAFDRIRFTRRKGAAPDGSEDLVTEFRYTTFGDLFQTVLPRGNVIEYSYDAAGRLLTVERKPDDQPTSHGERVRYELNGNSQRVLEAHERWEAGAWVEQARTAFGYSSRCHLDTVTSGSGAEQSTTEYAFDCRNNLAKIWDANHPSSGQTAPASSELIYDALDRVVEVRQPYGGAGGGTVETRYLYDVQDHVNQIRDGEGTLTSYRYSDRDLLTLETSEVSGATTSTYSPSGQLATRTDARGIVESRSYDALDRLTSVDYLDQTLDIAYSYETPTVPFSTGRLTQILRNGHAVDYAFDRFGRLIQDGALSFEYDQNSNRIGIGYPGGAMATYSFDFADRESTLSFDDGGGSEAIVSASSYLPSGPLDGLTLGNGLEENRLYDSRFFPKEINATVGATDLLTWGYAVDAVGNPTAITDVLNPANDRSFAYQDHQYFLTQGDGPWGTLTWSYDRIGNRLSEQRDGGFVDSYSYEPNAAMTGNSPKLSQIMTGGGVRSFQYDVIGNQTQVAAGGNVIDRIYDEAGRLRSQERPQGHASTEFLYDGRGILRSAAGRAPAPAGVGIFCDDFETGDTSGWDGTSGACLEDLSTAPVYDSSGLLYAVDATSVLYFAGRPVAQYATDPVFLTTDHLGTPILATDGAAGVSWEGGFEPFGTDFAGASAAGIFLRLPGQWENPTWESSSLGSSTAYNLMRWYQPEIGHYGRVDPIQWKLSGTDYIYSLARPTILIDPLGLFPGPGVRTADTGDALRRDLQQDFACISSIASQVRRGGGGNRFKHCFGNCRIVKECPSGRVGALLASLYKEFSDVYLCLARRSGANCDSAFQREDFGDNARGRSCAPENTCEAQCKDLRDVKDPPAGLFKFFKP